MGAIKVIKINDGKPYISLEDFIKELETLRIFPSLVGDNAPEFLDAILNYLNELEQEYYTKTFAHIDTTNPQATVEIEIIPAKIIHKIDDHELALSKELLQNLKLTNGKLDKEQSKIADEIDGIAGANLKVREWVSPEEQDNYKTKMNGIKTICSHAYLKYDSWTMLVEAVQKKSMSNEKLLEMIQQRIQDGQSQKFK